jgi:translation initiation factor 4G
MLQELYKKVRGVLNKLTPQKFHKLLSQVQALTVDSSDHLEGVINLVFEVVRQPSAAAATLKNIYHIEKILFV